MKINCGHCGCKLAEAYVEGEIAAAIKAVSKVAGTPCCGACEPDALKALQSDAKRKPAHAETPTS